MDETDEVPDSTEIPLGALLRGLAESFDAKASARGGRVVCGKLLDLRVRGNEEALALLFGNILDNAVRHGPAGGTVRIWLRGDGNQHVTVCVHDEGGNISPEALSRLFDRFYRVDSSRAQATGGSGLGLAIAREIARRHGGDIEIESAHVSGTRVSVRLPLANS